MRSGSVTSRTVLSKSELAVMSSESTSDCTNDGPDTMGDGTLSEAA